MKKTLPIFLIVTVFVLVVALQVLRDYRGTPGPGETERIDSLLRYKKELLDITFSTPVSKVDVAEHSDKVVILTFWASWCSGCVERFRTLVLLSKKFDVSKLLIVGINVDDPELERAISKMEQNIGSKILFPNILDSGRFAGRFDVSSLPSTFVYWPTGELDVFRDGNSLDQDKIINKLNAAM